MLLFISFIYNFIFVGVSFISLHFSIDFVVISFFYKEILRKKRIMSISWGLLHCTALLASLVSFACLSCLAFIHCFIPLAHCLHWLHCFKHIGDIDRFSIALAFPLDCCRWKTNEKPEAMVNLSMLCFYRYRYRCCSFCCFRSFSTSTLICIFLMTNLFCVLLLLSLCSLLLSL